MDKRLSKKAKKLDEKVVLYLLAVYHQFQNINKIFGINIRMQASAYLKDDGTVAIQLYEDDNVSQQDSWEFVEEYRKMFKDKNPARAGSLPSCKTRMKELFARNPNYTPEIVLTATKKYLRDTDPQYIMNSHYFIYKGRKQDWDSNLENWCNRYIEHINNHGNTDTTEGRAIKGLM